MGTEILLDTVRDNMRLKGLTTINYTKIFSAISILKFKIFIDVSLLSEATNKNHFPAALDLLVIKF